MNFPIYFASFLHHQLVGLDISPSGQPEFFLLYFHLRLVSDFKAIYRLMYDFLLICRVFHRALLVFTLCWS